MEGNQEKQELQAKRVETPDDKGVFLFRYDNPNVANRNPNSDVSQPQLVGRWFTDSPQSLKDYIHMRPPGGNILIVDVPKDKLEELKVTNHHAAKDMDISAQTEFIVPDDILSRVKTIPLTVPSANPNMFPFRDWKTVDNFVDQTLVKVKQSKPQGNSDKKVDPETSSG